MADIGLLAWPSRLRPAGSIFRYVLVAVFLFLVFAPLAFLLVDLAIYLWAGGVSWPEFVSAAARRGLLLINSVRLSAAVAAAAMIIGTLLATVLWAWNTRPYLQLRWLAVIFAAVPPYIHALAWSSALAFLTNILNRRLGTSLPPLGGWGGSWWVQVMALLPQAIGLALVSLEMVDPQLLEAGRMSRSDGDVLSRIALPLAAPTLLAGGGIVFILSLMDYSVTSLFGKNVYPLEIFAEHSATGKPASAFLLALPLLFLAVLVIYFSQSPLREAAQRPPWGIRPWQIKPCWPRWFQALQYGACILLALQILVPLFTLSIAAGGWNGLGESLSLARREVVFSLGVALGTAVLVLLPAYGVAQKLVQAGKARKRWWFLVTLPLALPAPLVGIGLIVIWNRPFWGAVYGSAAMPLLAALARFTPLAALLLVAQLRRIDPLLLDAARMLQKRPLDTWLKIWLPLMAPGLLAASFLCFALTLGELGATLIIAPPGMATLTMRLYNLLHYGATELVAGLCLLMTVATVVTGALVMLLFLLWARWSSGERNL